MRTNDPKFNTHKMRTMELSPHTVASAAVGLFILSLSIAHVLTPYPISKLGKRPLGKGLWTYLYSQLFTSSAGIWGFDSSLGSFCPFWRLSFHISAMMMMYAFVLVASSEGQQGVLAFLTVAAYAGAFFVMGKMSKGVSDPGGPRAHKIRRMPQWNDENTSIDDQLMSSNGDTKWRCAVAKDSHRATLSRFGLGAKDDEDGMKTGAIGMSGEPIGRQMWTKDQEGVVSIGDAQKALIKDMASAGRDGFNPSKNPNTGDMIFREQMITDYVANGGTLPDTSKKADTIKEAARKAVHFYSMLQSEDGHWAGDYGGPHFLMPGLIISWYVHVFYY